MRLPPTRLCYDRIEVDALFSVHAGAPRVAPYRTIVVETGDEEFARIPTGGAHHMIQYSEPLLDYAKRPASVTAATATNYRMRWQA